MDIPPTSDDHALGPYRLLRTLGEGGMGKVYLAHDTLLDRRVAIKLLRPRDTPDEKLTAVLAKRFLREARSAARINHPHVVTIYTVGQPSAGGPPYLVMEYIEGGSLADHLRHHGPLPWRDALAATRDALRGLAAAHAKAVIHRDVKPANLLCARSPAGDPLIKLVDFGLARVISALSADGDLTFPGAFVGSPSYSSPEQVAGAHVIDGRADLYGLAATCYALLTGQPPFVDPDPAEVLQKHLHSRFPDVRLLAPAVPPLVQKLLTRASEKNPADRFPTAADMLAAVEEALALPPDLPTRPRPTPKPPAPPTAEDSVAELESRLALARAKADSSTQLDTLRSLYGLYAQLDRPDQAARAYREALVLHIKIHAPTMNAN